MDLPSAHFVKDEMQNRRLIVNGLIDILLWCVMYRYSIPCNLIFNMVKIFRISNFSCEKKGLIGHFSRNNHEY